MSVNEVFQYDNITYSIVDVFRREVRVGTGVFNETFPNAVNINYSDILTIPSFTTYSDKLWRVVEIGTCSFAYCNKILSVKIGYNIEILKNRAFFRCYHIENITFEKHSRLKTLETYSLYDLYGLKSIEFGGDKLQTIGNYAFGFSLLLKYIRFPPSVRFIDEKALRGLDLLSRIDFCCVSSSNKDIFFRIEEDKHLTPTNVTIKVTSRYQSEKFGIKDSVDLDNSIVCIFPHALGDYDLQCRTVAHNNYFLSYSLFSVFILMYDS
ncbi:hypothetical protein TVAG_240110 [Trichomonas vaginalis G3]|uniref:Surface antigen BspA-like n=1 Tax=Trichomonas vaginalis (strain ATCC PRA-98 / G3) TaxID=412133 RepID=A2EFF3_TRIV3|nr:ribonuclease inhibitor domain-containing protein [Trichomonas vaginalis G3]EAY08650.1 hypothetical protein TVAG_240110 [Trichomonas vaginalis G3]KAI5543853.1 ribonuclease inhibitor domain-containing protein [Trichomonas vaginalis G3]|eukprot:XP_001320873.1 hypothetical protein [Trichomonas vaginalis G3]